jgi:hypothetical protein|tara:strand:- start:528 stop:1079 length:552 start_codon:yes stop_codon:yes gene_type:complete
MKKDQLNLFKEPSKLKVGVDYNTVDVASIIPNHNIVPNRYFMKPTGGLHPFAVFHERLNTGDFPYIINTNYKGKGTSKVQHVVIRDTIEYPYVMLQSLDKRKNNNSLKSVSICIHKLAARAFLDPDHLDPYDYDITVVDHIDGKPWNYRLKNLRFVTRSENSKGARVRTKEEIFKIGLMKGLF